MLLVAGGAGFIGANFIDDWLKTTSEPVVNVDKMTYAGLTAAFDHWARLDDELSLRAGVNRRVIWVARIRGSAFLRALALCA